MDTAVIEGGTSRGWLDDALAALSPTGEGLHPPDESKIGVLFVHGIGSQRPGETLLSWSRSLLAVVGNWSARNGGPYQLVRRASVDFTGTTIPYVEAALPVHGVHPAQTWVMTEAYWAAQVRPPSIGEMVDWLVVRGVGFRIARQLAQSIARSLGLIAWAERFMLAVVVPFGLFIAVVVFVISRILAAIPVPWLRRNILTRSFDYFLGDWFGDVRIMLMDRAQAANVRSNVRRAIYALRSYGCGRIVIIGHSGGTFVSYMTLAELSADKLPGDRLITHGQALGLAWMLGDACKPINVDDEDALQSGDLLRVDLHQARPDLEWYDFHGTHDPAPAGGFEYSSCVVTAPWAPGGSTTVYNEASFRADHGAYWENVEGFVLPVARLIDTVSPTAGTSRFYTDDVIADGQARRKLRVQALNRAKVAITWLAVAAIFVVGPLNPVVDRLVGRKPANIESIGHDTYQWLANALKPLAQLNDATVKITLMPDQLEAGAGLLGLFLVAIAFVMVSRIATRTWRGWDRFIARRFLADRAYWPNPNQLYGALGLCVASGVLLLLFVASAAWPLVWVAGVLAAVAAGWQAIAVSALGKTRTTGPML